MASLHLIGCCLKLGPGRSGGIVLLQMILVESVPVCSERMPIDRDLICVPTVIQF